MTARLHRANRGLRSGYTLVEALIVISVGSVVFGVTVVSVVAMARINAGSSRGGGT